MARRGMLGGFLSVACVLFCCFGAGAAGAADYVFPPDSNAALTVAGDSFKIYGDAVMGGDIDGLAAAALTVTSTGDYVLRLTGDNTGYLGTVNLKSGTLAAAVLNAAVKTAIDNYAAIPPDGNLRGH